MYIKILKICLFLPLRGRGWAIHNYMLYSLIIPIFFILYTFFMKRRRGRGDNNLKLKHYSDNIFWNNTFQLFFFCELETTKINWTLKANRNLFKNYNNNIEKSEEGEIRRSGMEKRGRGIIIFWGGLEKGGGAHHPSLRWNTDTGLRHL